MAENLGSIRYDIEVGTADMLKAEAAVKRSASNVATSLGNAEVAAKRLNTEVTKSASGVKKAMQANLGQAGIQVQQFVGQLQGGQSAMVALAQQSADLGIVLGAPMVGVIVSLAAVLAGTLLPALFNSKSGLSELEKSIERTRAVMTVGAGGIIEYTAQMQELGRISKIVADYRIKTAMADATSSIKNGVKAIGEEFSKLNDGDIMTNFNDAVRFSDQLYGQFSGRIGQYAKFIGEQLGATGEESKKLGTEFIQAFKKLESAKTVHEVTAIQESIIKLSESTGKADKKLVKMLGNVFDQFDLIREGAAVLEQGTKGQDDLANTAAKSATAANELANALTVQIVALKEGERAAYAYELQLQGIDKTQRDVLLNLYDQKVALEDEKALRDANSKAIEQEKEAYIRLSKSIERARLTRERQAAAKEARRVETLTTQVQTVGLNPEDEIRARFERENQMLIEAEERGIEIRGTYAERRKQLAIEEQKAIDSLRVESNNAMSASLEAMQTQAVGAFAQFATGAKSSKDAVIGLANSILTLMIGAIVKQGSAAISTQQAVTTSQVASNAQVAASAAPAAATVSLASFGANAGPAIAGMLAASAIGLAISGGRQYGGAVSQGMYRVNEGGAPEIYSHGGKDYLMNTKNANIKPAGGGGGDVNVIVHNNVANSVGTAKQSADGKTIEVTINEIAKQLSSGQGVLPRTFKQHTNLSFRASR